MGDQSLGKGRATAQKQWSFLGKPQILYLQEIRAPPKFMQWRRQIEGGLGDDILGKGAALLLLELLLCLSRGESIVFTSDRDTGEMECASNDNFS
jgi:hypothetical protein